jgi:N-acetyl-anhydromuramyl-L-alanine amidase AmpD
MEAPGASMLPALTKKGNLMAQSPEYSDLKWIPPKSWYNANRDSVQLIVIHTTEGSAHEQSAEDGASYDSRRTDGTSTHYFHDNNSTVQCVRTNDVAYAALSNGNMRGIQHELCTRSGTADWTDDYHTAMLRRAAKQCARDAIKWDIPIRKVTPSQIASGAEGICGHVDITYAFPKDGGDHTDPGNRFPWNTFIDMVQDEMEDMEMDQKTFNTLMNGWVNATKNDNGDDTNALGRADWDQGIPNEFTGAKTKAWVVLQAIQRSLMRIEKALVAEKK